MPKTSPSSSKTAPAAVKPLTKDQLSELEAILVSDLRSATRASSEMEESFSGDRERASSFGDPADASDALVEAERASMLGSHTSRTIFELRRALDLLRQHPEQYGICEVSGERIPYARLEALPTARTLARFAV